MVLLSEKVIKQHVQFDPVKKICQCAESLGATPQSQLVSDSGTGGRVLIFTSKIFFCQHIMTCINKKSLTILKKSVIGVKSTA